MKTPKDPRHIYRRKVVKELFAESFVPQALKTGLAKKIVSQKEKLDKEIQDAAPIWPLEKLNKIDLAVLRLAVYELKNTDNPPKVIIDEAVELSKEFGSETSPSFVNGVLGTIYKKQKKENARQRK